MAKRTSRTGTPNTGGIAKRVKGRILNPWGKPVPLFFKGRGTVSGSAVRKSSPSPELKGMDYPKNKPYLWPVVPDFENHTLPPPQSGLTQDVIDANNAATEQAYNRAGYQ